MPSILLQADYSQAELRTLACLSGDAMLRQIYLDDKDAHTATAAAVYEIPIEQVSKAQRNDAKPINFGIPYGMSEEGLVAAFTAQRLKAMTDEARTAKRPVTDTEKLHVSEQAKQDGLMFLQKHKQMFAGVWRFMAGEVETIRRTGKLITYFGRTRHLPDVDNRAMRQAYNVRTQSMASDLTLLSLVRIAKALRQRRLPAKTRATVYDSLLYEIEESAFWEVAELVHHVMTTIQFDWMTVPFKADLEAGHSWGELKKVDLLH